MPPRRPAMPRHLFTSQAQINAAKEKIEAFKNGTSTYSDKELWEAKERMPSPPCLTP